VSSRRREIVDHELRIDARFDLGLKESAALAT
jgi:hypothetical protein